VSDSSDNSLNSLDARLRDVAVPRDLSERIKASLAPSDDDLDVWLRRVAVPETLTLKLLEVPDDVALDERLVDVPTPAMLTAELYRASPARRLGWVARQLVDLALAASWFLVLSVTIAAAAGALLSAVLPQQAGEAQFAGNDSQPDRDISDSGARTLVALETLPFDDSPWSSNAGNSRRTQLVGLPIERPNLGAFRQPTATEEWNTLVDSGLRPLDDVMLLRFGILGSPQYADDRLPEIDAPLVPRAVGIQPPLARGYDRAFFLKHRLFPPLSPARPQLASIAVPLVTESDLLAQLTRMVEEDRRPAEGELRVEDFLAAMNYRFADAPDGRAALRTFAGPSPFGPAGTELLQIGVQAGSLATRPQAATHLVLAIDLSHSMRRGGRLLMLQQGIDRLLGQLGSHDRLSLVVFHEEVTHRLERATRDDAAMIRALLADLAPRGGTNLAVGLQAAVSVAMSDAETALAQRLVLITDNQAQLTGATLAQLDALLAAAHAGGVRLDVLDIGERDELDPVYVGWAADSGGEARPVRTARQLYWSLVETLAGTGPVVASDCKLTVQFNPQAVMSYRLIGHEANALAELAPATVQAELAAGEAATALFELQLTASDSDDVGTAELTWRDSSGKSQRVRQRISRLQFAPTFGQSALPLVQAAIAAEIGQELVGVRAALRELGQKPTNSRGLAGIFAAAGSAHEQVRQRPDFQRLLDLARQLERR
jgi:Ca-activated chloride channel family protein